MKIDSMEPKSQMIECKVKETHYQEEALGWVDGIYVERVEGVDYNAHVDASISRKDKDIIILFANDYVMKSKVWTETEETGFGVYEYIESNGIEVSLENKNYNVEVVIGLENDMENRISIKANRLSKIIDVDYSNNNVLSFPIAIYNNQLELQVYRPSQTTKKEECVESTVRIERILIREEVVDREEVINEKQRIYLLSDSTVQTYDSSWAPQTGWGQKLIEEFKLSTDENGLALLVEKPQKSTYITKEIEIYNKAIGGRSIRSFLNEGRLDEVLLKLRGNDYVFIQFGHNDDTKARPNRFVKPEKFYDYFNYYVDAITIRGGIPVLISPVARRNCDEQGNFRISFNNYREVMIRVSEERNIPFLDLGKESTELLQGIGAENSKKLYMWVEEGEYPESNHKNGVTDNTHLSEAGASLFAGVVSKLIKEYNMDSRLNSLKKLLK